jgi:hypothetical protein
VVAPRFVEKRQRKKGFFMHETQDNQCVTLRDTLPDCPNELRKVVGSLCGKIAHLEQVLSATLDPMSMPELDKLEFTRERSERGRKARR